MKKSLIIFMCAAALVAGCSREPAATVLPVADYIQSPGSLEDHAYSLTAIVERQAAADADGALVVVAPTDGSPKVPLYLPAKLRAGLSPEQRIVFLVRVQEGVLHVTSLKKK